MSDINKQMAEFAKELWENYIKPKVGVEFSDTVRYYMATVVSNDGYNRVTIKRPFDDAYQVSCLDDMAGLEAGDTVLVLRFGSGTNNANHIVFGKGNGNMNYTAAAATATATEASVAAGQAAEAAAEAIESAGQAASAAESAQESAQQAQESANTANQAANNALIGLATVEGVVDTVNWFAEHKTASTDTSVVPSKTYYEYNPVAGTLSAVTPEGDENPSEEGWYELSEAISNYVATHIATTNDGLYVVGLSNGWKVLVSSGAGTYTAGIFLIDPSGNIAQATTANGITFDDSKPFYIGDNNASIVFDGNGHISISGIGVSIGSTGSKSINEILTELGASIKTIEYGVGNSSSSYSDITSWSSSTPEWQEDKYIWQRTTTNGLTYTYTCIQGAAGAPGAPGVSVSGVTNYYLATSQSSGVTRETTGWTTSIQTMTSTNQYLWNYEVVTGSDGSTLNTTDPIIIGRYGQDGGSGRGITGITEYYLASNQQTGITPSSSGWTTTVQTTTTATPYLWNYEVVTYSSGSPETSSARIIGTHGATGADGRMLYATSTTAAGTAAKTATLANGTLTLTAGATVAVTFTYANTAANPTLNVAGTGAKTIRAGGASLTATSEYNWTAGATAIFVYDGTYWQMDGTAALDKLGSLEIGGRNLLIAYDALPVADRSISADASYTYDPDTGTYVIKQTIESSGFVQIWTLNGVTDAAQIAGREVTLSARSITSSREAASPRVYLYITKSGGDVVHYDIYKSKLTYTITLPPDTEKIGYILRLDQNQAGSAGETATFVGVKCELGNVATDWTPAPEDTLAEIANIEVGGRNLSTGTGTAKAFTPTSGQTYFTPVGFYPVGDYGVSLIRGATTEDEWVVSFDYAVTGAATATQIYVSMNRTASSFTEVSPDKISVPVGNSSGHFSTVFQLTSEQITYGNKWLLSKTNNTDTAIRVTLSNFMFEKGNRASSWSPAPEDVEEAIEAVEDTATEALNKHGFCSCSTAASTAAKTASLTGFQLKTGSTVHVTFTNANSKASATLNINSTGAKTIKWNGQSLTATESPWAAGECVTFVYDGTYWVVSGQSNISADNIVSGSIAADRIKANVISAVNGGTGSINADKMQTNVISAVNAGVGTINADRLNISVGGTNLLRNSNNYSAWYRPDAAASYLTATSDYFKFTPPATSSWWMIEPLPVNISINDWDRTAQYTVSIDFKIEGKTGSPDYPYIAVATKSSTTGGYGTRLNEAALFNLGGNGTSTWKRYSATFSGDYTTWQQRNTGTPVCVTIYIWLYSNSSQYTAAYFRNIKLEKGNMATDWSPAPADSAATATNYITNISGGGITVTGNSASSKIEIASTVKVIKDSTHFTEMTASDFNVYSGNATYPVAKLGQVGASLSGDGAGVYLARILKTTFVDAPTSYGGTFELNNTSGGVGVRISAGPSYGTQLFYNSSNKTLLRIGSNDAGQGEISVFKATTSASTIAAKIGTITITSGGNILVNNEPTLAFYDSGTMRSWYSLKRAFISDGTRAGYVVYGNTANHGFNIDYLTSGRINFYVDGTSIGYATITSSDERMKIDIKSIDERYKDAIANVELKNFHFDFNDATRAGANLLERFGAIAQDVIAALKGEGLDYRDSELVETLEDDDGEYYVINYVPFLIARIAADEDRIQKLEEQNKALEERLSVLEDIMLKNLIRDIDET